MSSPTSRTLERLRKAGWTAQVTERWNAYAKIRQDLFGCIDIVAVKAGEVGVLGVQCTSRSNQSSRVKKCYASPIMATWLEARNSLQVWGWAKSKGRWDATVEEITL
jgi:hypothetical protein